MESTGQEHYPITIPVIAVYFYGFVSLALIDIQALANGLFLLHGEIFFLGMLMIGGPILLLLGSLAFTNSTRLLQRPRGRGIFVRYDPRQATMIILGLVLVSVWQLFINQIPYRGFSSVDPSTAYTLKIDAAIAEESIFAGIAVVLYLGFRRIMGSGVASGILFSTGIVALVAGFIFYQLHDTSLAYANNPQALFFVFGLRLIITPIVLYTHSIFSGFAIHIPWNMVS